MKTKTKTKPPVKPDVLIEDLRELNGNYGMRITVRGKEIFNGHRDDIDVWTLMDVIASLGHSAKKVTPEKR